MLYSRHLRMLTFYLFFVFLFFFAFSQTKYLVEILCLSELTTNVEFWAKPLNCPIAQCLCVLNKGVDLMTLNVTSSSLVYTLMTESFLIDADKLECSQERLKIQEWAILNLLILIVFNSNLKSLIISLFAVSRPSIFFQKIHIWMYSTSHWMICPNHICICESWYELDESWYQYENCCQSSLERPRWQFSWTCSLEGYHKANLEGDYSEIFLWAVNNDMETY